MIILKTNHGTLKIELDFKNTPKTAENFVQYAKSGFYDNTIFHRVINGFMIQGGGLDTDMNNKKTLAAIQNEAHLGGKNTRGTLAMARTSDPHSATAQFFINVADNHFLNHTAPTANGWGYCVFGHVVEGMDVVDRIKTVRTTSRAGHQDVPEEPILIESVCLEEAAA